METTKSVIETGAVRELPMVAGHLALDFANTVDDPEGPARFDHIATFPGLLSWSVRAGDLSPEAAKRLQRAAAKQPRAAAAALRKAHTLRHALSRTFTAVTANSGSATTHWALLQPFVRDAISRAEITPTTGAREYQLAWPDPDDFSAMLWPIAEAALTLLTGPDLHRVKRCAGCPWLFLDQSKNASRRWCAMSDCGTHEKIRRYIARRAERRSR